MRYSARRARLNDPWVACALFAAAWLWSGAPVAGATPRQAAHRVDRIVPDMARIVSPQPEAFVARRRVTVRVRLRPGVRRFHVEMDRRDVTLEFRRVAGSQLRVASLRLRGGTNHVNVSTRYRRGREDFDAVEVIGGRRRHGFLSVSGVGAREAAGPLRVGLHAAARPLRVVTSLNGRTVDRVLGRQPTSAGSVLLSATQGLRQGRNVLRVRAYRRTGTYDTERRVFTVSHRRPLAGAGADRVARQGHRLRLDGGASRPSHHGRRLAYRWRLIRRPFGSHARLSSRTSARPLLTPDRPGRYRASLDVVERAPGHHLAATTAVSAAAPDTVKITAQADWGPQGGRLDTIPASGAISLAGTSLASPQPSSALQVVVLDRSSLSVVSNTSYTGDATGVAQLRSGLDALVESQAPEDSIVVIVGKPVGGGPPVQSEALSTFGKALQDVGAQVCGDSASTPCLQTSAVASSTGPGFSVVGIPALDPGRAWQASGSLGGYLQLDQSGLLYAFVAPDRAVVDTGGFGDQPLSVASITLADPTLSGSVDGATIATGSLPTRATGGFLIAAVDSRTLAPKAQQAIGTNYGNAAADAQGQQGMVSFLTPYATDPSSLVFIQSLGTPGATTTTWGQIGQLIAQLGGTADTFNRLPAPGSSSPPSTYSLIGGAELEGHGAEAASGQPGAPQSANSPGTERVLLSRRADFRYQPSSGDPTDHEGAGNTSSGEVAYGLAKIIALPPTAWPYDDAEHRRANAWIAQKIGLCTTGCADADVRDYYVTDPDDFEGPTDEGSTIAALSCPAGRKDFSQQDCQDLITQLPVEIKIVDAVRQHVGDPRGEADLQVPYGLGADGISATLNSVTTSITNSVTYSKDTKALATFEEIASALLSIASGFVGPEDEFAEEAAMANSASGAFDLGDTVTDAEGGQPLVGGQIQAQAGELQYEAIQTYSEAVSRLSHTADLIVSDWGRLQQAATLSKQDPSWTDNGTDVVAAVQNQLQGASLQWFYESLLPIAYEVDDFGSQGVGIECEVNSSGRVQIYSGTPNSARYQFITGFTQTSALQPVLDRWAMVLRTYNGVKGGMAMSGKLSDALYAPLNPDFDYAGGTSNPPAGFTQPALFTRTFAPPGTPCEP